MTSAAESGVMNTLPPLRPAAAFAPRVLVWWAQFKLARPHRLVEFVCQAEQRLLRVRVQHPADPHRLNKLH